MENIFIESTPVTPKVNFDADNGLIEISGRSIPENPIKFYTPLIEWLKKYIDAPKELTTVSMKIEYFNTSSSKLIFQILKLFEKTHSDEHKVNIKWYYKDEDMLETGEDYQMLIKVPFEIIEDPNLTF